MINIKDNSISIEFSKKEKGTIAVQVIDNTLCLQGIIGEVEVGKPIEKKDVKELPKANLNFHNEKSVDVVIEALKQIKRNIKNPMAKLYLAC